ncbi:MAG: hypothetical protein EOM69_10290, partial [Clostridia bacterium]|nr:hypothetical protein [Clostridia bacterium]
MQPKNVVLIMADQMRKDSMGCYGNACAHTPNLDWLAGQSVRFERSYVANPICMPNRLSLFSGMTPSHHGLWTNGLCEGDPCKTLPETLRQNGYQTASIGKIHFSPYSVESVGRSVESAAAWNGVPDADCLDKPYYGFDYTELTIGHTLPKAHYYRWF